MVMTSLYAKAAENKSVGPEIDVDSFLKKSLKIM
jgi:hypothetical protein